MRLAEEARALIEAIVHTEASDPDVDAVTATLAEARIALERSRRASPAYWIELDDGRSVLATNPIDGALNPLSPPLRSLEDAGGVFRGVVRFGGAHEGPPGRVHGGWSAMVLDHSLARACLSTGHGVMTTRLEVRYRDATPSCTDLNVDAAVEQVEEHRLVASGAISAGGVVMVQATARFAIRRPARSRR
jgi:acyl-coenzyme A thioesterase PaaI-like protein